MEYTDNTCKVLNAVFFIILIAIAYVIVNWAINFVGM